MNKLTRLPKLASSLSLTSLQARPCSSRDWKGIPPVRPAQIRPDIPPIETFRDVIWPEDEEDIGELRAMEPVPQLRDGLTPDFKHNKRMVEARGVELVHNTFRHRQFGVVAVEGGMLYPTHFDLIRNIVNRHMNRNRFAVWRVEDPWLARTKKKAGSRMGGGRGAIKWYVTPVRARRVIIEVGGHIRAFEAFLAEIAGKLPMEAKFATAADLDADEAAAADVAARNVNPVDWDFAVKWNLQNCNKWLNFYDKAFRGKSKL